MLTDYNTLAGLSGVSSLLANTITQGQKRLPGLITIQQTKEKDEVLGKLKGLGDTILGMSSLGHTLYPVLMIPRREIWTVDKQLQVYATRRRRILDEL